MTLLCHCKQKITMVYSKNVPFVVGVSVGLVTFGLGVVDEGGASVVGALVGRVTFGLGVDDAGGTTFVVSTLKFFLIVTEVLAHTFCV